MAPIISSMQKTTPIRRYVLLRQEGLDAAGPRWSKEPIGSAPRDVGHAPLVAGTRLTLGARR